MSSLISSRRRLIGLAAVLPLAALLSAACSGTTSMSDAAVASDLAAAPLPDLAAVPDLATIPDTTAPTILSTSPTANETGVGINETVDVTFSEAMDPQTINLTTFSLKVGSTVIGGTMSYSDTTAVFKPDLPFGLNVQYTATVSTGAKDLAGNPLAAAYVWSFTTTSTQALGPAPVLLGAARNYVMLAKSAVSTVPTSKVTGNLGVSPAAATYITGFSLTRVGTYWTSTQVIGRVYAADNDPPTPTNLTTAVSNMETAYTDAAGRPTPDSLNLGAAGEIGGLTFAPGLHKWTSSVTIATDVTLSGGANDVWIFQVSGDLSIAAAKQVKLINGARAKNVFWQVAGKATMETGAHFEGILLCKTEVTTGAGASIIGRLLAQTAVKIASTAVTAP